MGEEYTAGSQGDGNSPLFPTPNRLDMGGNLVTQTVKRLPAVRETRVRSLGWEDTLEKWQPVPALLLGKSHGRRSLAVYSAWGRKASDTTERLLFLSFTFCGLKGELGRQ